MSTFPTTTLKSIAEFRNESNVLFNPTTVQCTVTKPDMSVEAVEDYDDPSTYPPITMTRTSTGVYKLEYDAAMAGKYTFKWYGVSSTGRKITEVTTHTVTPADLGL